MRGRLKQCLVWAAALLTVAFSAAWLCPSEPLCNGERLSFWFDRLTTPEAEPSRSAIVDTGPRAMPWFFRRAREEDSLLRKVHEALWRKCPRWILQRIPPPRKHDGTLSRRVGWVAVYFGKDSLPAIGGALQNPSLAMRRCAADVLGHMSAYPEQTVPLLARALKDRDCEVRLQVLYELDQINPPATKALPALVQTLREKMFDSNGEIIYVREAAARLLARMGEAAEPAVPPLKEMMEDSDSYTRQQAAIALWQITHDPNIVTEAAQMLEAT